MTDIQESIEIAAPPEQVWSVLTDFSRLGDWVDEHRGFPEGAPEQLRDGVSYRQTLRAAGSDVDIEWTVVEHDAPRSLAFDGEGPAGSSATLRYTLSTSDSGTCMEYSTSFSLPGGPLGSLGAKVAAPDGEDARETLSRFKGLVES